MYIRLKELREKNNLTQLDISNYLEISRPLYSLYETGKREISISLLSKLAKKYNTSIDYLIGDTDQFEPYEKSSFKS